MTDDKEIRVVLSAVAMHALLSNPDAIKSFASIATDVTEKRSMSEVVADAAIGAADALVAKLSK